MCNVPKHNLVINTRGDVQVCCIVAKTVGNICTDSWDEIWNGTERSRLIREIEQGTCEDCKHCARYVDYQEKISGESGNTLEDIDLRVENTCNCACKMCYEAASSKIAGKRIGITEEAENKICELLENHKDTLKHVHFAGGEPLISKSERKFLEKLSTFDRFDQICLTYNTNCTVFGDEFHQFLWKKARKVHFDLSIDAIGTLNDQIRVGSQWEHVESVLNRYIELQNSNENIFIRIHPTFGIYNISEIAKIESYFLDRNVDVAWGNIVDNPKHLSIFTMSSECLQECLTKQLEEVKTSTCREFLTSLLYENSKRK